MKNPSGYVGPAAGGLQLPPTPTLRDPLTVTNVWDFLQKAVQIFVANFTLNENTIDFVEAFCARHGCRHAAKVRAQRHLFEKNF